MPFGEKKTPLLGYNFSLPNLLFILFILSSILAVISNYFLYIIMQCFKMTSCYCSMWVILILTKLILISCTCSCINNFSQDITFICWVAILSFLVLALHKCLMTFKQQFSIMMVEKGSYNVLKCEWEEREWRYKLPNNFRSLPLKARKKEGDIIVGVDEGPRERFCLKMFVFWVFYFILLFSK